MSVGEWFLFTICLIGLVSLPYLAHQAYKRRLDLAALLFVLTLSACVWTLMEGITYGWGE